MGRVKDLIVESDGKFYVTLQAVMHPWVAFFDGLPMTFFGKKRDKPYLELDQALAWAEKEAQYSTTAQKTLEALRAVKAKIESGNIVLH